MAVVAHPVLRHRHSGVYSTTITGGQGGTLHANIAAEALDAVAAWLHGSPHPVPDTAEIITSGPRTYLLRW